MFKVAVHHTKRFVIGVIGGTLVAIGVALFVLPGPGLPVVILGLAILATEFMWAKRFLHHARNHYDGMKAKVLKKPSAESDGSDQNNLDS